MTHRRRDSAYLAWPAPSAGATCWQFSGAGQYCIELYIYICYPGPGTTARKFSRRARRAACSSSWLHEGMALLRARSATDCWPGNGTQQQPRMGSMDGSYGFYPALGGSVWVSTATGRSWVRCGPTMPTLPALHAVCVPLSEPTDSLPSAHPRADRTARPSRCAEPD